MALIPGSSQTDPRYANYNPGRPLTLQEMQLRQSLGALPQSSPTNYNAANFSPSTSGYQIGGWYNGRQWDGTRLGNPGEVIVGNTNGGNAGGGGGGGGGTTTTSGTGPVSSGSSAEQLAQQAYDGRIRAIQALFDRTKQQAGDVRSEAEATFDDLLEAVGAFRERAGTLRTNAGQEITNQASNMLGTNARTSQELVGKTAASARNLGLSSKLKLGQSLLRSLQETQGNVIARRGEQDRANQALYDTRLDQADTQEAEAGRYRTSAFNEARRLENTGLAEFGDNVDAASNTLGTSLNNIINYQRQLAAINAVSPNSLNAFDVNSIPAIGTTVGSAPATSTTPQTTASTGMDIGNPVYSPYLLDILNKMRGLVDSK